MKTKPIPCKPHTGTLTLSYWWKCESFPKGIPKLLAEALDEIAKDRAFDQLKQGYTSGELLDHVNLPNLATEQNPMDVDGWVCRGWWELKGWSR